MRSVLLAGLLVSLAWPGAAAAEDDFMVFLAFIAIGGGHCYNVPVNVPNASAAAWDRGVAIGLTQRQARDDFYALWKAAEVYFSKDPERYCRDVDSVIDNYGRDRLKEMGILNADAATR